MYMEGNNGEPRDGGKEDLATKKDETKQPQSVSPSKDETLESIEPPEETKHRPKKSKESKIQGVKKTAKRGKLASLGATAKRLWEVWGRFKTKNTDEPNPSVSEKTLGVPGFEEIACIEAEVPDIMLMDKDRVRTSCKECMKDPPTFPTREQIKAKLIAVDEYYGVNRFKTKPAQGAAAMEHDADYYDVDGAIVRPSWRFILERPLVEQYVLMTNYIRKVSVLSEMKGPKSLSNWKEEEDSVNDPEYKKFERKFIKERRDLLTKMQKPQTQDVAVQASIQLEQSPVDKSLSEISLYPESEELTNSPEPSAVTIVTSRDYSSPLQSDFDGRTTDKSASYQQGSWWQPQSSCQISESVPTSCNSFQKNTSSGTDGQSIPVHSTWGETQLQPAQGRVPNESDTQCRPPRKPKQKTVSFSPAVTYYHGKDSAVPNTPEDLGREEVQQEHSTTVKPPENNSTLENILQDAKHNQIVSVSMPAQWKNIRNQQLINVAVSRSAGVKHPERNVSFQKYEEIPDVVHSDPNIATVDKTDANIQTQTPILQKRVSTDRLKGIRNKETPISELNALCLMKSDQIKMTVGTELVEGSGMGTNQSALPSIVSVRLKSPSPPTDQTIGRRLVPGIPKRSDPAVLPSSDVEGNANPSGHPKPKQTSDCQPHNPFGIIGTSQKPQQQQQSTDTEGSSTSNEHLRLKASPACFFKVATPTDLSRISVDDFYPDVPEIDAELSKTSEPSSSSQFKVVFANQATCHQSTRTNEIPTLPRSTKATGVLNPPNIEELNVNVGYQCSPVERKAQIKDASQQSIITQGGKSKVFRKMPMESTKERPNPILNDLQHETNLALKQPKIPPFAKVDADVNVIPNSFGSSAGSSNEGTAKDVIAIQCQKENLVDSGNQVPQERTNIYVRTLSSLVEETSSAVDTSSTQDKLVDMPAVSIGELKTIFEKKSSGESQRLEENGGPKKCAEKAAEVPMAPRDDAIKIISDTPTRAEDNFNIPSAQNLLTTEAVKLVSNVIDTTKHSTAIDSQSARSRRSGCEMTKNAQVMNEEPSAPQLSEVDVIRASEIYSNTSMYFSTSEDRMAKLNKARAVFQPITLGDDLGSCSKDASGGEKPQPTSRVGQGSSGAMVDDENHMDSKQKEGLKVNSNHEGADPTVGQDKQKLGEAKMQTEPLSSDIDQPSDDTSTPEGTKHWLMDAIPVLPRNTRFHGLRPHRPVCVKVTEAEAEKFRQEAMKPVFKFLKRLRE